MITGFAHSLPNGRLTAEMRSEGGSIIFRHMTPEQALKLADEMITIAKRIEKQAEEQEASQ